MAKTKASKTLVRGNAQLGDRVKDSVSGFTGIVIARTSYINGCVRILVQPPVDKDGKLPATEAFDEPQLYVTEVGAVDVGPEDTGGPAPYASRPSSPTR